MVLDDLGCLLIPSSLKYIALVTTHGLTVKDFVDLPRRSVEQEACSNSDLFVDASHGEFRR